MNDLTEFQKKVLATLPLSPGHKHVNKIVHEVYGDYVGWKRARGRKIAVIKALWKMRKLGKVNWWSSPFAPKLRADYWYKK